MFKKIALGVVAVLVLVFGVVSIVGAQDGDEPAGQPPVSGGQRPLDGGGPQRRPRGRGQQERVPLEVLAEALAMPVEDVRTALMEGQTVAELAEAQGIALDDVIDAVLEPLAERLREQFENGLPEGRAPGGRGEHPRRPQRPSPQALAEVLGLTVEDMRAAFADGQTVAELAEAQGVSLEDVIQAMLAPQAERLAQAVQAGRLTQEEADEKLADMAERLRERFENGLPEDAPGGGPGR